MSVLSKADWRTIARWIETEIAERRLVPGDKLPTEQALCEQFLSNRHTVRRALAQLQAKGLVESTQGRGSFVRRPSVLYRIGRRTRFSAGLQQEAADPQTRTLIIDTRPADPTVAAALGLKSGAPTVFLERLGFANGQPVLIARHWFAHERFPNLAAFYVRSQSITQTLIDCGVPDYTRVQTRVSARLPTPQESELLKLPRHVPLLLTQAWNVDGMGQPLEYGEARMASDRLEILIEVEPKPPLD